MRSFFHYIIWITSIIVLLFNMVVGLHEVIHSMTNPNGYYFGSESMIGVGGVMYHSKYVYIVMMLLVSVFSLIVFIISLKNRTNIWINLTCLVLLIFIPFFPRIISLFIFWLLT